MEFRAIESARQAVGLGRDYLKLAARYFGRRKFHRRQNYFASRFGGLRWKFARDFAGKFERQAVVAEKIAAGIAGKIELARRALSAEFRR